MGIETTGFFIAVGAKWKLVGGLLLTSGVLLLSGHQDVTLRAGMPVAFPFFMAIVFVVAALITAIGAQLWGAVVVCAVALCLESWLIRRLWERRSSG